MKKVRMNATRRFSTAASPVTAPKTRTTDPDLLADGATRALCGLLGTVDCSPSQSPQFARQRLVEVTPGRLRSGGFDDGWWRTIQPWHSFEVSRRQDRLARRGHTLQLHQECYDPRACIRARQNERCSAVNQAQTRPPPYSVKPYSAGGHAKQADQHLEERRVGDT
jgi:hypothetical protein